MYKSFYGLTRTPFAVTPDPAMLFMSKVHREALATIIYGVETRKGFIVCTGEVGTGKSTIIRAFFDQARADAVKLIYIFTPQVTPLGKGSVSTVLYDVPAPVLLTTMVNAAVSVALMVAASAVFTTFTFGLFTVIVAVELSSP